MTRKPSYRKIKKDYQHKDLCNPFFGRKPKGKRGRFFRCLILLSVALIIAVIWFFFASPVWKLKNLEITGLTRADDGWAKEIIWRQAEKRAGLIFRQSNIFLFDEEEAENSVKDEYNLVNVVIKKKLPRTLKIEVQERPYAFIYQEGNDYFHASADAYIIREPAVAAEDRSKYFTVENNTGGSLIGEKDALNIKKVYLDFILTLGDKLSTSSELPLEKIIIDQEFNMATAKILGGPAIYFSINETVDSQIDRLLLVKKEKIKDNFSKTNYIDLRYGDRIFISPDFN